MGPGPGSKAGTGEKAKDFKKTWGQLILYSKLQIPAVIIALVCAAIGSVLSLVGPNQITNLITNGFMKGIDIAAIVRICVILVIIYALSALLSFPQGFIMATVTQRITKRMRSDVSQKINRLPISYFNKHSTGNVLSRVTNDVDTIGQTMNQSIGTLVSAVMNKVRPLPKGFKKWVDDVPFGFSRYIYYKRHGKTIDGYCTACHSDVMLDWAKHNKKGVCPSCGKKVTFKAKGLSGKAMHRSA